ncbi:MAG: DUF1223 domain-containing protein [Bryobacter sp.]|nr:DUF1223 domain-containing protein [Bryobacter sp.]
MNRRTFLAAAATAPLIAQNTPFRHAPLVELFTSQGCSSCPPADKVLEKIHQDSSAIVLSQHVDYWNYIGWHDPFSQRLFTARQNGYAQRLGLDNIYTPQAVVNGTAEMVGSDERRLRAAIARSPKASFGLEGFQVANGTARVSLQGVPDGRWETWAAIAQQQAEVQVNRGENRGRLLGHVNITRALQSFGASRKVQMPVEKQWGPCRLIVWLQQPQLGKVLGGAMADLS